MAASLKTAALSPSSPGAEIIRLRECEGWDGRLTDIIEPDGEDIILAEIAGRLVELPRGLSEELWALMGQKIRTARILGQIRLGAQT